MNLKVDVRSEVVWWLPNVNGRYNTWTGNIILEPWSGSFGRTRVPIHEYAHFMFDAYFDIGPGLFQTGCESSGFREGAANAMALSFMDRRVNPRTMWPSKITALFKQGPGGDLTDKKNRQVFAQALVNDVSLAVHVVPVGECVSNPSDVYYDGMSIVQVMWNLLLNRVCMEFPCDATKVMRISDSVSDAQMAEVGRAAFSVALSHMNDGFGDSPEEFLDEMYAEIAAYERWAFATPLDWHRLKKVFSDHGVDTP